MTQAHAFVDKSQRSLEAAQHFLKAGDHDFAVSHAYYAMFYLAKAAVLNRRVDAKTHQGIIHLFWEHYVKPETVPARFHSMLDSARDQRVTGDYQGDIPFDHDDAAVVLNNARDFLKALMPIVTGGAAP